MDANKLVAHRGDNTNYPENSYAAMESALMAGAHYIEFDIQMNADGTLVVFHDVDFKRMANNDASVFETTDTEMKAISAHQPQRFAEQHYPMHVPTLNEILSLLKGYPKAQAFVEIKWGSLKHWGLNQVMNKLLTALKNYSSQVIVISFSVEALEYTKLHSEIRTGFVFEQYHQDNRKTAYKLKPDYLLCPYEVIPHTSLWEGEWQWIVYSLNEVVLAVQMLKRKDIDIIETDNISLLLRS